MCGEKVPITCVPKYALGSPPRMRGKAAKSEDAAAIDRITPACAGKSSRNETCWHRPWDHPCVCGEKIEMPYELLLKEGSPPRMRGKAFGLVLYKVEIGITPACAGKSVLESLLYKSNWGSPLRMRGKVVHRPWRRLRLGITPAYAGKSPALCGPPASSQDYPRVCGEKPNRLVWDHWKEGSPPRMRGKELSVFLQVVDVRITPACAGKRQ